MVVNWLLVAFLQRSAILSFGRNLRWSDRRNWQRCTGQPAQWSDWYPIQPGQLNGKIGLGLPVAQVARGSHALLVHRLVKGQHEGLIEQDAFNYPGPYRYL